MPGKKKPIGKKKLNKLDDESNHVNDEQDSTQRTSGDDDGSDAEENNLKIANNSGPSITKLDMQSFINNELTKRIQQLSASTSAAKDLQEAKQHNYQFWQTQPVPKLDEKVTDNTFIEPSIDVGRIRPDPFSLPTPYVWSDLDINSDVELNEVYSLLSENYVEDDDNMFRFDYSCEFLRWALLPPGWLKKWHCGVRSGKGKLVAFISAIPTTVRVYDKTVKMVEINFLCVHKQLRNKRVAPVLIREITRRVNQEGIFQAAFTAGVVLPKPIGTCRYYHRSLNPKKLIETKFSHLPKNMTMQRTIKLYKLSEHPKTPGLTVLESKHIEGAYKLLFEYLKKFDIVPMFEQEDFEHFFLPRNNVIYSYVVENERKITDLISFYCLPSSVMHHPTHKKIRAAYSFYNVATTVSWIDLMNDALIMARKENFDVFNALDLMENKIFLDELKFGIGDGNLQYYLYNWKCPDMKPENIGLVLQ